MEHQDYINFADLRRFIYIDDKGLLIVNQKKVYKDLSNRSESNIKKGISK